MSDSGDTIAVTGIGLHSSLGSINQAAASFRAGLIGARELPNWGYVDEALLHEHVFIGHPAAGLPDGFGGIGRLVKLAVDGLTDLKRNLGDRSFKRGRLGFCLVFPDALANAESDRPVPSLSILKGLRKFAPFPMSEINTDIFLGDEVGAVHALQRARTLLQANQFDACVVGAIDSLLDAPRLISLIRARKIKTVDNAIGLVPGECASIVLLERSTPSSAREADLLLANPYFLSPNSAARTGNRAQPPAGTAERELGALLLSIVTQIASMSHPGVLYSDLDGDPTKASNLANALQSSAELRPLTTWRHEMPAISFGNTGVAAPLLALSLAVAARRRRYLNARNAVVVMTDPQRAGAFALSEVQDG